MGGGRDERVQDLAKGLACCAERARDVKTWTVERARERVKQGSTPGWAWACVLGTTACDNKLQPVLQVGKRGDRSGRMIPPSSGCLVWVPGLRLVWVPELGWYGSRY